MKQTINFDQYKIIEEQLKGLELKQGRIDEIAEVPKSSKLLKMTVYFGEDDTRTVVTNIKNSVSSWQELIGKKMLFITNLEPTKIMGIESKAMIFANQSEDGNLFFSLPL